MSPASSTRTPHYPVERITHRWRFFLPLPTCRCARAQNIANANADERDSGNLSRAVSPVFGPVRRVDLYPAPDGMTLAIAQGARMTGSAGVPIAVVGSATDRDPALATTRAVAEALERYAAGFWSTEALVPPTYRQVYGTDCDTGEQALVPAAHVFLPFDPATPNDAAGLAAGATREDAIARALAERIERDVAKLFFDGRRGAESKLLQNQILLGRDGGHEVWLTVRRAYAPPFLAVGLGASRDSATARSKSRAEAQHVAAHMALLGDRPLPSTSTDLGWLDRAVLDLAFDAHKAQKFYNRLTAARGGTVAPLPPQRRAVVDITTSDVATLGLYVARVVVISQVSVGIDA